MLWPSTSSRVAWDSRVSVSRVSRGPSVDGFSRKILPLPSVENKTFAPSSARPNTLSRSELHKVSAELSAPIRIKAPRPCGGAGAAKGEVTLRVKLGEVLDAV